MSITDTDWQSVQLRARLGLRAENAHIVVIEALRGSRPPSWWGKAGPPLYGREATWCWSLADTPWGGSAATSGPGYFLKQLDVERGRPFTPPRTRPAPPADEISFDVAPDFEPVEPAGRPERIVPIPREQMIRQPPPDPIEALVEQL
jgi:hypothetical protein